MNEELMIDPIHKKLAMKVIDKLEQEMIQGWIASEVCLSSRCERMTKAYRHKLKNKIPKDQVS